MPSSYADYVQDWESLLDAVRENQDQLPNVDDNLIELSDLLDQVKQTKTRQELHAGARQKATQDVGLLLDLGKEAAVKLRGFVKAKLGPKNELLATEPKAATVLPRRPACRGRRRDRGLVLTTLRNLSHLK